MSKIIFGLLGIALGFLMVYKPAWFFEMIGEQAWAEKIFGAGHGTTAYQVIGLLVIFVSFLIMMGLVEGILGWFFGPVINAGI